MTAPTRQGTADRVAATLRKSIADGRLKPGDALPSERELADKYDVNRSTIREAMKRLEAWGLVKIRHGGATRVADFFLSAGIDVVPWLLEVGAKVDPGILNDLHEIRGMFLGWAAGQAAEKADPASVARLDELARKLSVQGERPSVLQDLDYDFFQELIAISGNRLLGLFGNVGRQIYAKGKQRLESLYVPGVFDPTLHRRAVEAIRVRDPRAAAEAMREHAFTGLRAVPPR